jgi:hypothetical protein
LVITHLFEGCEKENFGLVTIVNKDFGNVSSVDVDGDNHGIGVREWGYVHILGGEGYGHMGPFDSGYGAFDNDMIDLSVIVSMLSLGFKIGVGASGGCEDCAVGG